MIQELRVRNVAIFEEATLSLSPGFTALTGETGAGKSILVDAVELVLGARGGTDLVRSGAEEAVVEALFDLAHAPSARAQIEGAGIESGESLLVRRTLSRQGRGRVQVNGNLATLQILARVGEGLVDLHGQHEHQRLLHEETHLEMLDQYAGSAEETSRMAALHARLREIEAERERLAVGEREKAQKVDLLSFQVQEIDQASLKPGEEEALKTERERAAHVEKLSAAVEEGYGFLYAEEGSAVERIGSLEGRLKPLASIDPELARIAEGLAQARAGLEEVGLSLRDYRKHLEFDPGRLEEIEGRLDLIGRLKRKYGGTIEEILAHRERAARDLERFEGAEEELARLEREAGAASRAANECAEALSRRRRESSRAFSLSVERELKDLGMRQARFSVEVVPDPDGRLTAAGWDHVRFVVAPNPGEGSRPLARIASGGELSRVMLALKRILADRAGVPSVVFDELDAGVGGGIAEVVGRKLRELGATTQVLCITHLPQVAALADQHLRVVKEAQAGRTRVRVEVLDAEGRVEEIARMLGGLEVTEATRAHAREMLASARALPSGGRRRAAG